METKRGCPTEDGVYHILSSDGWQGITVKDGNRYLSTQGDELQFGTGVTVVAHRSCELLAAPSPLKELAKSEGVPCVIRYGDNRNPLRARRYDYGTKHHMLIVEGVAEFPTTLLEENNKVEFLTKEQCEAAGFAYPENCK